MRHWERRRVSRNKFRNRLAAKGYMEHTVQLRKKSFTGSNSLLGIKGTHNAAADELITITPPPLLFNVNEEDIREGNGVIRSGDIRIMQIDHAFRSMIEDRGYEIVVTGPEFGGVYSRVDGRALELTPMSLAIIARAKHDG